MYVCVSVGGYVDLSTSVHRSWKHGIPLELELEVVVSHHNMGS